MSEPRMMKVARCKTCGKAFAYSVWPVKHPGEDMEIAERLEGYLWALESCMRMDRYSLEGDTVTIEPWNEKERLDCRCHG